jgi:hypothetical protein
VIPAAAVHPAPAVSAQAEAQALDVIAEAVFSIAFQTSSTLQPSARADTGTPAARTAAARHVAILPSAHMRHIAISVGN